MFCSYVLFTSRVYHSFYTTYIEVGCINLISMFKYLNQSSQKIRISYLNSRYSIRIYVIKTCHKIHFEGSRKKQYDTLPNGLHYIIIRTCLSSVFDGYNCIDLRQIGAMTFKINWEVHTSL